MTLSSNSFEQGTNTFHRLEAAYFEKFFEDG